MRLLTALLALTIASPTLAADDSGGTLNPDEMSLNKSFNLAKRGKVSIVVCAQGYLMTKKGSHEEARKAARAKALRLKAAGWRVRH